MKKTLLLVLSASLLGACGQVGVKPWERDLLAQKAMQFDGNAVDSGLDDHIHFSKEAASGGRGFGGGGCGCN